MPTPTFGDVLADARAGATATGTVGLDPMTGQPLSVRRMADEGREFANQYADAAITRRALTDPRSLSPENRTGIAPINLMAEMDRRAEMESERQAMQQRGADWRATRPTSEQLRALEQSDREANAAMNLAKFGQRESPYQQRKAAERAEDRQRVRERMKQFEDIKYARIAMDRYGMAPTEELSLRAAMGAAPEAVMPFVTQRERTKAGLDIASMQDKTNQMMVESGERLKKAELELNRQAEAERSEIQRQFNRNQLTIEQARDATERVKADYNLKKEELDLQKATMGYASQEAIAQTQDATRRLAIEQQGDIAKEVNRINEQNQKELARIEEMRVKGTISSDEARNRILEQQVKNQLDQFRVYEKQFDAATRQTALNNLSTYIATPGVAQSLSPSTLKQVQSVLLGAATGAQPGAFQPPRPTGQPMSQAAGVPFDEAPVVAASIARNPAIATTFTKMDNPASIAWTLDNMMDARSLPSEEMLQGVSDYTQLQRQFNPAFSSPSSMNLFSASGGDYSALDAIVQAPPGRKQEAFAEMTNRIYGYYPAGYQQAQRGNSLESRMMQSAPLPVPAPVAPAAPQGFPQMPAQAPMPQAGALMSPMQMPAMQQPPLGARRFLQTRQPWLTQPLEQTIPQGLGRFWDATRELDQYINSFLGP